MSIREQLAAGVRVARVANGMRRLYGARTEDAKALAREQLCELFAAAGGLPAKVGQLLGMRGRGAEFEALGDGVEPIEVDAARQLFADRVGRPVAEVFDAFEPARHAASFGQVHRARSPDGTELAVKLRYPGIERAVQSELALLRAVPRVGPMRRVGLNLDEFRALLSESLLGELDYCREMRDQRDYARTCRVSGLVVPEVVPELCADGVLTQRWESGQSIDEIVDWPVRERARVAEILVRHFVRRLFVDGVLHADPHAGNYRFRRASGGAVEVVLMDYGSVAHFAPERSQGFLRLLCALRERERVAPAECLALVGFDADKLDAIADRLPALVQILFEPFLADRPLAISEWRPGPRVRELLGESAWWFRSAAPASLLLVMRAWAGLLQQIERLDVRPFWSRCLDSECGDAIRTARTIHLTHPAPDVRTIADAARQLVVRVEVGGEERIALTLPARAIDRLRDLMDVEVHERLTKQGIDVEAIADGVRRRGYPCGEILNVVDADRRLLVRLE